MKKTISIGSQSFKYLREEDLFYIDKTDFIIFQPENPWSLDRGMNGVCLK